LGLRSPTAHDTQGPTPASVGSTGRLRFHAVPPYAAAANDPARSTTSRCGVLREPTRAGSAWSVVNHPRGGPARCASPAMIWIVDGRRPPSRHVSGGRPGARDSRTRGRSAGRAPVSRGRAPVSRHISARGSARACPGGGDRAGSSTARSCRAELPRGLVKPAGRRDADPWARPTMPPRRTRRTRTAAAPPARRSSSRSPRPQNCGDPPRPAVRMRVCARSRPDATPSCSEPPEAFAKRDPTSASSPTRT
jgi:hypothetical protein